MVLKGERRRQRVRQAATVSAVFAVVMLTGLVVISSTSRPDASSGPATSPAGTTPNGSVPARLVTSTSNIFGRWEAIEIGGQSRATSSAALDQRPYISFTPWQGGRTAWSAGGVCNPYVGSFSLSTSGVFRAEGSPASLAACLHPDAYPGNPRAVLSAERLLIEVREAEEELQLVDKHGTIVGRYTRYDWATDTDLPHAAPGQGAASAAYLRSYTRMVTYEAADRARADGWTPQLVSPADATSTPVSAGTLRLVTDESGTFVETATG